MKIKVSFASLLIGTTVLTFLATTNISHSQSYGCYDVQMVYARGSNHQIGESEWSRFDSQIRQRLDGSNLSYRSYELGSSSQYGYQYPAIPIDNIGVQLGAWISSGTSHSYGKSVQEGEAELRTHLAKIINTCPDTRIILGGYSQGAHVMGNAIRAMTSPFKDAITFAALFGDPKLHLPEGEGFNPPACHYQNFSPWRRTVEDCHTDNGVLGARQPYTPKDMEIKVGLWCLNDDFICGSSKNPWISSGHQEYDRVDGPIDQAAQEIAQKLKSTFTYQSHLGEINTAPDIFKKPTDNVAIMFVLDWTTNMIDDYPNFFYPKMKEIADAVGHNNYYGIDHYIGCREDNMGTRYQDVHPPVGIIGNFTSFQRTLTGLPLLSSPLLGCDLSWELAVHTYRAQHEHWWPPNRQRIIIPVTNTPYDPNATRPPGLLTQAHPASDTLIIPLVPDAILPTFKDLDTDDAQLKLTQSSQIAQTIVANIKNPQISARLSNTDYRFPPGSTITFDASPSLVHDDTITKYEWDFNDDGIYDIVTTKPTVSHTYATEPLDNTMSVRLSTQSGLSDTVTANVTFIDLANIPPIPDSPTNLQLEKTSPTSVKLTWEADDNLANHWNISLNDFPLGYVDKDQLFIEITDIRPKETTIFGVQAVSADFQRSEWATITLNPQGTATPFTPQNKSTTHPLSSSLPSPQAQTFQPAANLLEVLTQTLGSRNNATSLNPAHRTFREPSPALIYYIIGGVAVTALIASGGWILYKRFFKGARSK